MVSSIPQGYRIDEYWSKIIIRLNRFTYNNLKTDYYNQN